MKRTLALIGLLALAGCGPGTREDRGPVRTDQPHGWEQADLARVPSGTEVYAFDRFKLLYALGSTDPKTNLPREFVVMLSPEYIPSGGGASPGKSANAAAAIPGLPAPRPGKAVLTNTEPVVTVHQGYSYIWGRWPLISTSRVSGIVEQFQGGRSRTIIWIDQAQSSGSVSTGGVEVHRIFFLPELEGERLRLTLTEACSQEPEVVLEKRAYVEIIREGGCNRFAGPPVFANADGWWGNPHIDDFVKAVFEQRENAGLQ